MAFKTAIVGLALVFASAAPSLKTQEESGSQPFRGLLDPDADLKSVAATQTEYRAGLLATDKELAALESEITPMRADQLAVSYAEGRIVEGTRYRCMVSVAVARKSIARILSKDSLRLEVQLAILLEAVNDEVDRFAALLANQVTTQEQESVKRGLDWAATLERVRKGDGERRVEMLRYVVPRVPSEDHTLGKLENGKPSDSVLVPKAEYEQLKADRHFAEEYKAEMRLALTPEGRAELRDRHRKYPALVDECGRVLPPVCDDAETKTQCEQARQEYLQSLGVKK